MKNKPWWWWLSTWFGAGKSPIMPGTVGSLAALPFAYLIQVYSGSNGLMIAAILLFVLGCFAADKYVKATGSEDAKEIVIDEVAVQWLLISMLFPTIASYAFAFLAFRAFD